jgi:hypothetical protein
MRGLRLSIKKEQAPAAEEHAGEPDTRGAEDYRRRASAYTLCVFACEQAPAAEEHAGEPDTRGAEDYR